MMLNTFLLLFEFFFTSTFFTNFLIYFMALGLVPASIYTIWLIVRGYVN